MKFKVDENLPVEVVELFLSSGYDALSVFDQELIGETDPKIASVCQQEARVLVTLDLDFSDVRLYPPPEYPGLIVLRLRQQDKPYVLEVVKRIIVSPEEETVENRLWIVEENRIRVRGE